jgi:hypothetical protein
MIDFWQAKGINLFYINADMFSVMKKNSDISFYRYLLINI